MLTSISAGVVPDAGFPGEFHLAVPGHGKAGQGQVRCYFHVGGGCPVRAQLHHRGGAPRGLLRLLRPPLGGHQRAQVREGRGRKNLDHRLLQARENEQSDHENEALLRHHLPRGGAQ